MPFSRDHLQAYLTYPPEFPDLTAQSYTTSRVNWGEM